MVYSKVGRKRLIEALADCKLSLEGKPLMPIIYPIKGSPFFWQPNYERDEFIEKLKSKSDEEIESELKKCKLVRMQREKEEADEKSLIDALLFAHKENMTILQGNATQEPSEPDAPWEKQGRRQNQVDKIVLQARTLGYKPQSIPHGGKANIKKECLKDGTLFTDSAFDHAWRAASKKKLIQVENIEKYKKPHNT